MGREANCRCAWGAEAGECKVLLETEELVVRGSIRKRATLKSITAVAVRGEDLCFRAGKEDVTLGLGAQQAGRWAKALTTLPPSLAAKLGISPETKLLILGEIEEAPLEEAVAAAAPARPADAGLVISVVLSQADLAEAVRRSEACALHPPLWIVYVKGPKGPVPEGQIRSYLRERGWMDTKVASVSAKLTALRFNRRGPA
jgi:hypothetical protein